MKKVVVGTQFYEVFIDDDGKAELHTYEVRSIRRRRMDAIEKRHGDKAYQKSITPTVHLVRKCQWTWGKVSKKNGDYGWLPNPSDWLRKSFKQGERPKELAPTALAAWKAAARPLKTLKGAQGAPHYLEDDKARRRALSACNRAINLLKKK